jgi:hypothetical protein
MSDTTEAEQFAAKVLTTMGPTETLLMAMRLVLLVGQQSPEDPVVIESAQDALGAIQKMGRKLGLFPPVDA